MSVKVEVITRVFTDIAAAELRSPFRENRFEIQVVRDIPLGIHGEVFEIGRDAVLQASAEDGVELICSRDLAEELADLAISSTESISGSIITGTCG